MAERGSGKFSRTFVELLGRDPDEAEDFLEADGAFQGGIGPGDTPFPEAVPEEPEPELLGEGGAFDLDPDGDFSDEATEGPLLERVAETAPANALGSRSEIRVIRRRGELLVRPCHDQSLALSQIEADARDLFDSLLQRRQMLIRIGNFVVQAQRDWFDAVLSGEAPHEAIPLLKPLKQADVALCVEQSAVVVSRLVNSCYVTLEYPGSPQYPLHFFFSRPGRISVRPDVLEWHIRRLLAETPAAGPVSIAQALVRLKVLAPEIAKIRSTTSYLGQLIRRVRSQS